MHRIHSIARAGGGDHGLGVASSAGILLLGVGDGEILGEVDTGMDSIMDITMAIGMDTIMDITMAIGMDTMTDYTEAILIVQIQITGIGERMEMETKMETMDTITMAIVE